MHDSVDIVIAEGPAMRPSPQPQPFDVIGELAAIRAALEADMDEYAHPSMTRCGLDQSLPLPSSDHDADDPYWRRFVRMGESE